MSQLRPIKYEFQYAGHTWRSCEDRPTRAQKRFLDELCEVGAAHTGGEWRTNPWTTTQFRRLAPFIALNTRLIEELPRTTRGGWGYRLRSEVKP